MPANELTALLKKAAAGDSAAQERLAPIVHDELKRLAQAHMRREAPGHSVQATLLVSDAFMRLVNAAEVDWESRAHFFALSSRVMRLILVEHARARRRHKRGGNLRKVPLDEASTVSVDDDDDVVRVDEALRTLASVDPRQAEIVTLRFFGGMSMDAVAETMGMSKRAAEREWTFIKAWLRRELAR